MRPLVLLAYKNACVLSSCFCWQPGVPPHLYFTWASVQETSLNSGIFMYRCRSFQIDCVLYVDSIRFWLFNSSLQNVLSRAKLQITICRTVQYIKRKSELPDVFLILMGGIHSCHVFGCKRWAPPQYTSTSCPIRLQESAKVLWGSRLLSRESLKNDHA